MNINIIWQSPDQLAHCYGTALSMAGCDVRYYDISSGGMASRLEPHGTTIFAVDPGSDPLSTRRIAGLIPSNNISIMLCDWPFSEAPRLHSVDRDTISEIWCPSAISVDAIRGATDIPVALVSPPVLRPRSIGRFKTRDRDRRKFIFMYVESLRSYYSAGDAYEVVRSYRRIFPTDQRTKLVVYRRRGGPFERYCRERGVVVSDNLVVADCYISLCRAGAFDYVAEYAHIFNRPMITMCAPPQMSVDNYLMVDHTIEAADPDAVRCVGSLSPGTRWRSPNFYDLSAKMVEAVERRNIGFKSVRYGAVDATGTGRVMIDRIEGIKFYGGCRATPTEDMSM